MFVRSILERSKQVGKKEGYRFYGSTLDSYEITFSDLGLLEDGKLSKLIKDLIRNCADHGNEFLVLDIASPANTIREIRKLCPDTIDYRAAAITLTDHRPHWSKLLDQTNKIEVYQSNLMDGLDIKSLKNNILNQYSKGFNFILARPLGGTEVAKSSLRQDLSQNQQLQYFERIFNLAISNLKVGGVFLSEFSLDYDVDLPVNYFTILESFDANIRVKLKDNFEIISNFIQNPIMNKGWIRIGGISYGLRIKRIK